MTLFLTAFLFSHPTLSPTCSPSFLINAHPHALIHFGLALLIPYLFEMSLPASKSLPLLCLPIDSLLLLSDPA